MSTALEIVPNQESALLAAPNRAPMPLPWNDWAGMVQFAQEATKAQGILPKHITSWQAALVIMQAGIELGIPPVQALTGIYMVQGRVTLSAKIQHGLVKRAYGPHALEVIETTPERCVVQYRSGGRGEARIYAFTMEMARLANLHSKDIWKQYPDAMLRARCISAVAGFAFTEVTSGMLTPEELDVPVTMMPNGDVVVDVTPTQPANPHHADSNGEIPNDDHKPAGQRRVSRLIEVAQELFDLTGESVEIPDAPTVAECDRLGRDVQTKLTAAKAKASGARIAAAQELAATP